MTRRRTGGVAALLVAGIAWPAGAGAQSSRAEELAMRQAAKAESLRPYEKVAGERILDVAEELLQATNPLFPWVGSVYPGGQLAFGGGYQRGIGDVGRFRAFGARSIRGYTQAQAQVRLPELVPHVAMAARVSWLDAPSVAFFGTGPASNRADETTFGYRPTVAGVSGTVSVTEWLALGGGADYLDVRTDLGALGETFGDDGTFGGDVSYTVGRLFAGADWRDSPGYTQRGGLYRVEWARYGDRSPGRFSFQRTEAEVVQMVPLARANWIVGLRGLVTTTRTDADAAVPVFMMPALGGGASLRGFPSWRFRDRNRLLLSGEYRWTPGPLVDMALFVDAGKVAPRARDLDLRNLARNYGIGIRFHGPTFTALRFDLARSREGWVLNVVGGTAF